MAADDAEPCCRHRPADERQHTRREEPRGVEVRRVDHQANHCQHGIGRGSDLARLPCRLVAVRDHRCGYAETIPLERAADDDSGSCRGGASLSPAPATEVDPVELGSDPSADSGPTFGLLTLKPTEFDQRLELLVLEVVEVDDRRAALPAGEREPGMAVAEPDDVVVLLRPRLECGVSAVPVEPGYGSRVAGARPAPQAPEGEA